MMNGDDTKRRGAKLQNQILDDDDDEWRWHQMERGKIGEPNFGYDDDDEWG